MWPSTLQNSGLAGVTRPDGVGPFSATAIGEGGCIAAESIFTALSAGPARPLQVAAASPFILAAIASAGRAMTSGISKDHARASIGKPGIASSSCGVRVFVSRSCQHGRRKPGVKADQLARHLAAALRDQPGGALVAEINPQPTERNAEA